MESAASSRTPGGTPRAAGGGDGRGGAGGGPRAARERGARCEEDAHGTSRASNVAVAVRSIKRGPRAQKTKFRKFVISESRAEFHELSSCRALAFVERVVHGWAFEVTVSVLVLLNLLATAVEAQYTCTFVAEDWGYSSGHVPQDERQMIMKVFATLETVFGVAFIVELVLRFVGQRIRFFADIWNWVDFALVIGWLMAVSTLTLSPTNVRVFRVVRILRLVRLVRRFKEFDALCLMMTAMKKSTIILGWAVCLFLFFLVFLTLLAHEVLLNTYLKDRSAPFSERQEIYRYFGSFTKTLFSMFELTFANWPPIARALSDNVSEWFMLATIVHKLTIGFALVGIINAVFIQETFKVAQEDTEILWRRSKVARKQHEKNMRGLMQAADLDGDGRLDAAEFRQMFDNPALRSWLASQEFREEDADEMFDLMDDGDGRLSIEQVAAGMARLKGTARTIDLHILMEANRRHLDEQLSRLRGSAPAATVGGHTGAHENMLKLAPAEDI